MYLAKSAVRFDGSKISVKDHISKVSEIAGRYGSAICLGEASEQIGLLHDLGKYSDVFQDLLAGKVSSVDHAMSGAAVLIGKGGVSGYASEAVAAHHECLISREMLEPYIRSFLKGSSKISPMPKGRMVPFDGMFGLKTEIGRMLADGITVKPLSGDVPNTGDQSRTGKMRRMLMSRMLLSCLVDADHTVSAWEESGDDALFDESVIDSADVCLMKLEAYRNGIMSNSKANPAVNKLRDTVYSGCIEAGTRPDRLSSLTAPTGSGKTLAMIRFTLEKVKTYAVLKRVIFVLPYLSLVDQVADACRNVFSGVLVDDSVENNPDRLLSKRWNAPCIVTTSVQFFQSLFSAYPGDVRKLHRLAGSVIVFDEVQSLPSDVFRLALDALKELSERYGSHILLSTATKPGYGYMPDSSFDVHECMGDAPSLFSAVRRTGIEFLHGNRSVGEIAAMAAGYRNSCVVSNLKKQALAAYQAMKDAGAENLFLVSTDLCPEHRRDIVSKIGKLQRGGMPVHVSSTQCLEAGVDLDFEKLFRMIAPFTALVQAAGRQDRNGNHPGGNISVFVPDDKRWWPDGQYRRQAEIVMEMSAAGIVLDSLSGVDEYYRRLFRGFEEPDTLTRALHDIDFVSFAKESRLIKSGGKSVVVPYDDDGVYEAFVDAVLSGSFRAAMLREVAGITVQTYDYEGVDACCVEAVIRGYGGRPDVHTGTWVLLPSQKSRYSLETGLTLDSGFADIL